MRMYQLTDKEFAKYGQRLEGYNGMDDFLETLKAQTPTPEEGFVYKASEPVLEAHPVFDQLKQRAYGWMPIQLGYCNGSNTKLNYLEYHKTSEVCIMALDTILLLGLQSEIEDWKYDTKKVRAFFVPAGSCVELYATTLHYAPCNALPEQGFKVANCLPKSTNAEIAALAPVGGEDNLMWAVNKWLLAHAESDEAMQGAYVGLVDENIDIVGGIG